MAPAIYGIYYILAAIYSFLYKDSCKMPNDKAVVSEENVALLMTVCDDFDEISADSLLNQSYRNYHVFILDDSKKACESVIEWCNKHANMCTRLTRKDRRGFKAGNLNEADKNIPNKYELFCVVDSDQKLPQNYLSTIWSLYCQYDRPAFVQGIHAGKLTGVSKFSGCLAPTVFAEWRYHIPYKNAYGQTGVGGHGYLIKRSSLQYVGGHPEIVSEDLALTMALSSSGFDGVMTPLPLSEEAYPQSVNAIQSRRFRWVAADWEVIFTKYFSNFLVSGANLIEKADLFLREIRLPVSSIYYLILVLAVFYFLPLHLLGAENPKSQSSNSALWIVLFGFSPVLPVLLDHSRSSLRANLKAFFAILFVGISMLSVQLSAGLYYLRSRQAFFWVTNSNEDFRRDPRRKIILLLDFIVGFLFATYGYFLGDMTVLLFGLGPLIRQLTMQPKFLFLQENIWILGVICFVLIIHQTILGGGLSTAGLLLIGSLPFLLV